MKNFCVLVGIMLFLGIFTFKAYAQNLTVVNETGFSITTLILADVDSDERKNLLNNRMLAYKKTLKINITGSSEGWLLIAADAAGTALHLENINLTGITKIILFADGTVELK